MPSENKQLAKRAKREAKRKILKQQNAVKKVETNKARKLVMGRREALTKLRDDIFDFIVKKNSFKKFLKDMIDGANALKATNDAKYDGIIVTAYEKGLAKMDELIEPRLVDLAKLVDNIDPNKTLDMSLSEYLDAGKLFSDLSNIFNEVLSTVNRYHNHNVSIYKNTEDPEKITEFSEDDFNFDFLKIPTDIPDDDDAETSEESAETTEQEGETPVAESETAEDTNSDAPAETPAESEATETTEVVEEDTKTEQ